MRYAGFALLACALFLLLSLLLHRTLRGDWPPWRRSEILLHASFVFALAVSCEVLVDSLYEGVFGHKLWEYRVLPAHEGCVSRLAPLVWPSYGVHLYWLRGSLAARFGSLGSRTLFQAAVVGLEAPLFFEVVGNLLFLGFLRTYYARYVPGDLWHLTSLQVVPVYGACALLGFLLLDRLRRHRLGRHPWLPLVFLALGLFVVAGPGA